MSLQLNLPASTGRPLAGPAAAAALVLLFVLLLVAALLPLAVVPVGFAWALVDPRGDSFGGVGFCGFAGGAFFAAGWRTLLLRRIGLRSNTDGVCFFFG